MKASAVARANIALVKYWGKRDEERILPANGSISLTLDGFTTLTTVETGPRAPRDELILDGKARGTDTREFRETVSRFIGLVRHEAGMLDPVKIVSRNDFPTGAGLASSASGYAALACALNEALALGLDARELSILARRGSGSATRSVFGGFVEWVRGERGDGSDSHAVPLAGPDHWPAFRMVVCLTDTQEKKVKSRAGMASSVATSPFWGGWLRCVEADLEAVRHGVASRDFSLVGATAEANALKMHAVMMTTSPSLLYWNPRTVQILQAVREWREGGLECYFTMDAGPQVKILCIEDVSPEIRTRLSRLPHPPDVVEASPGEGVALTEKHLF